jgi:hypothetical protein
MIPVDGFERPLKVPSDGISYQQDSFRAEGRYEKYSQSRTTDEPINVLSCLKSKAEPSEQRAKLQVKRVVKLQRHGHMLRFVGT